jgi:hypothetical protein
MSSFRAVIAVVLNASACVLIGPASADAQTCSISSSARGPLECAVTTSVRMTLRVPALVGVTVATTADAAARVPGATIRAGVEVKANRSYALQIASAPADQMGSGGRATAEHTNVVWSTAGNRARLSDTPTQLEASAEPTTARDPLEVAFASQFRRSTVTPRFVLTIVAP